MSLHSIDRFSYLLGSTSSSNSDMSYLPIDSDNHKVQSMKNIYSRAVGVVVWLGDADSEDSLLQLST